MPCHEISRPLGCWACWSPLSGTSGGLAPIRSFALTSAELTLVKMIDLMDGARAARAFAGAESAPAQRETVLRNAMKPFAMSRGQWRKKLLGIVGGRPETEPCYRHH